MERMSPGSHPPRLQVRPALTDKKTSRAHLNGVYAVMKTVLLASLALVVCLVSVASGSVFEPGATFVTPFERIGTEHVAYVGQVVDVSPGKYRKEPGHLADYAVCKAEVLQVLWGEPGVFEEIFCPNTFFAWGGCWERRIRWGGRSWVLPGDTIIVITRSRPGYEKGGAPATFTWLQHVGFLESGDYGDRSPILKGADVEYLETDVDPCGPETDMNSMLATVKPTRVDTGFTLVDVIAALTGAARE